MDRVEQESQGQFRIFSKLGAGYSSSRSRGEIVSNAYGCFPVYVFVGQECLRHVSDCRLDPTNGAAVPNQGWEFTVHVRGSVPNDASLRKVEEQVTTAMKQAVQALLNHQLPA